ncbi:MSMEG_0565 family glycosyltransferase [Actinospica sp. MGRD01-02]|uniref:MSMEG_0565 family glycosyltransferase n=1 Tax=Actinospica acidithermotolerans TaxID=2828514 RepID=A0A941E907_9ACTN|nr:MSMEG_0565 family glycosyltransferase [Actinospica acidithermotolerans]MBR7827206.1 MSMEG_0565 family glycosyltransferase [Actinospica acidithermotolerans]
MKIALLSYSTKPRGGVVHTLALAEALAALGEDVTVWSLGRGGDQGFFRPVDPSVQLRVVPFPDGSSDEGVGPRILRSIAVLRRAFESASAEYDIVHAQDCISANAAMPSGPCIRTVHHIDHFTTPELAACHERAIVEPYAHLCVSRAVADELAHGWGIKAEVIPNGVAYDRFAATDPAARAARRAKHGRYILTVGGIEPRKGSLDLLEAYALLRAARPDVSLVIGGGETLFDYRDYRAAWEARARELSVHPIVLGPVPDDELPALVAGADAFAFPSTKEGFGLAAMEALAAGTPLVVRDLPVLREVFADAARFAATVDDFAAELHDALAVEDPTKRDAGRILAARHTWTAAAHRHLDFYRTLADGVGRGSPRYARPADPRSALPTLE